MELFSGNIIPTFFLFFSNAETGSLVQIINHWAGGVLTKMKAAVEDFFDLPLSEKKKYAMAASMKCNQTQAKASIRT